MISLKLQDAELRSSSATEDIQLSKGQVTKSLNAFKLSTYDHT